jgi:FkbM family methyltransferase
MNSEIATNEDGTFIIFPNDYISQHVKYNKPWEPHFKLIIKHLIEPGSTVLDGGANLGYNSVLLGKQIGPTGTLISFEPQKIVYQQLNGNLIINNIFNAITYNAALGKEVETSTLIPVDYNADWANIGDTSIGIGGEIINVIKLDDISLNNLDFIKLDVQGYELFALQGAENHILKYQPDLFIEIEDPQLIKFGLTGQDLINYIKSLGYNVYKIDNSICDYICSIKNIDKIEQLKLILPLTYEN